MFIDYDTLSSIYLVSGYTDLRLGIDGLVQIIQHKFEKDIYKSVVFLFCGRRSDRFKALYWDINGFYLLYKRIETGKLQWPREEDQIISLTKQQSRWLFEGLNIHQKKALKPEKTGKIF